MHRLELTPRQETVAQLVATGARNREIAERLGISPGTVKQNVSSVMIKWNCVNRTQVAAETVRRLGRPDDSESSLPAAG